MPVSTRPFDRRLFGIFAGLAFLALVTSQSFAQARLGGFGRQIDGVRDVGDVAYAPDGTLYAIDGVSGEVLVLADDGSTRPAHEGGPTFRGARGLAVGGDGVIYIADTSMHRLVRVGADGTAETFATLGVSMAQMNAPRGMDLVDGRLAVADAGNGRVQIFSVAHPQSSPVIINASGDDRPMVRPVDASIEAETGRVFIVDEFTHRVYRASAQGIVDTTWGGYGSAPGLLNGPSAIAVKGGRVYVADSSNHRVQVFDTDGAFLYWWGLHTLRPHDGAGRIHYPSSLALSPSGDAVALGEAFEDRVQIFGAETAESRALQEEDRLVKRGVSGHFGERLDADGTLLALIEPETAQVIVYDTREGVPIEITRLGGYGDSFGRLIEPSDVLVDDDTQHVFVADRATGIVSVWTLDRDPTAPIRFSPTLGRFERAVDLGSSARYEGLRTPWPPKPLCIERARDGSLLAYDEIGGVVIVADERGVVQRFFMGLGYGAEELRAPTNFCELPDGRLAFASPDEGAITVFTPAGEFDRRILIDGGAGEPFDVVVDGETLLVTDRANHTLSRMSVSGRVLEKVGGTTGVGKDELFKPAGVAVSEHGLWIVDYGNHRLIARESIGAFRNAFGPFLYVDEANGVSAPKESTP